MKAGLDGSGRRTALVLAGGGITGFLFEVGALAALEEALPAGSFPAGFDLFVGTSAGSVAAALLANGARPSEIFRAVGEDLDSPFNFRAEDVFGSAAGSLLQLLGQFARPLGGALGRALGRGTRPNLAAMLADFQRHHPPGFYSTAPLERTLCARFDALGYRHRFDELPTARDRAGEAGTRSATGGARRRAARGKTPSGAVFQRRTESDAAPAGAQGGGGVRPAPWRPRPAQVDEVVEVLAPGACPGCGGEVAEDGGEVQYQADLPPVRPHITAFHYDGRSPHHERERPSLTLRDAHHPVGPGRPHPT